MIVAAAASGTRIALVEPASIIVHELPQLEAAAEIAIAGDFDVAFVGDRRLAILERAATGALLHVVDPVGPVKLGEVAFRAPMRIVAVTEEHVLVAGAAATSIVDLTRSELEAAALPLRAPATAAAALDRSRFVIAAGGMLEMWDAGTRAPTQRVRLDPPRACAHVGGNAHRMWMIPQRDTDHLEVISMTSSSSRRIELPERPLVVAAHRAGDLVALIGADTQAAYVIDLDSRERPVRIDRRLIGGIAWLGNGRTLALKPLDEALDLVIIPALDEPRRSPAPVAEATVDEPEPRPPRPPRAAPPPVEAPSLPAAWSARDSDQMAAWRERQHATIAAPAPQTVVADELPVTRIAFGGWRLEAATWARSVIDRKHGEPPALDCQLLGDVVARLGLDDACRHAIALLYGAHLCGVAVTAMDLATILRWRWDDIVGTGRLASSGAFVRRGDRFRIAPELVAFLDELPPRLGTAIGATRTLDETVAVIAPDDVDLARIGAWAAARTGALLAANASGEVFPARCAFEARIRGLAPLLRGGGTVPRPGVLVLRESAQAAALGIRVAASWPD